jgi:hypothetical protein
MEQQNPRGLAAMARRIWVSTDQARDLAGVTQEKLLSAVRDGARPRPIAPDNVNIELSEE